MKKTFYLVLIIATIMQLLVIPLHSQKELTIITNVHYGFVIPHHASVVNLIQGHSKGLEVSLNWQTNSEKRWYSSYNHPSVGLDFYASNLGNDNQLGNQFSSVGYVGFPIGKTNRQELKVGVGIGYASKIWDLENNAKNLLLSSHLNAAVVLQYGYKVNLNDKYHFRTGLRITHFSNGSYSLPNKGTNNLTAFVGFSFVKNKAEIVPDKTLRISILPYRIKKITSLLALGVKQISLTDPNKYATFSLTTLYEKRRSQNTSWGVGLDLLYSSGLRQLINDDHSKTSIGKAFQLGAVVSYTKHLDPWEIKLMIGAYLIDNYKENGLIYNRFGVRYWFNEHLFSGFSLKTHYAKADHAELGVGWRF